LIFLFSVLFGVIDHVNDTYVSISSTTIFPVFTQIFLTLFRKLKKFKVVTMDDLCRLLDYGKDVFERVATGFFVEIRAPPNPNNKKVFFYFI